MPLVLIYCTQWMLTFVAAIEALAQRVAQQGLLQSSLHHASFSAVKFYQMFILWRITINILHCWWYTMTNDQRDKLKEKYVV